MVFFDSAVHKMKRGGTSFFVDSFATTDSFTLVEILIVVGILAVLTGAVVVTLNPVERLKETRDVRRMSDLGAIHQALVFSQSLGTFSFSGSTSTVYTSLVDPVSTSCLSYASVLPTLPSGWNYHCATSITSAALTDGTGWVPVNIGSNAVAGLASLPLDPTNDASPGLFYAFVSDGLNWEMTAKLESSKYQASAVNDGGASTSTYEIGTSFSLVPSALFDAGTIASGSSTPPVVTYTPGSWVTDSTGGASENSGNSIAEVNGTLYVLAGQGSAFRKYDPGSHAWTALAAFPPNAYTGASIVSVSTTLYAFGGGGNATFYSFDTLNPGNGWTQKASLPGGVNVGGALVYPGSGDLMYAFRGANTTAFWEYSIANNSWSVGAAQNSGNSIAEVNGALYVLAGQGVAFQKYDSATHTWTGLASFPPNAYTGASIVAVSTTLYAFGGGGNATFYSFDTLNPGNGWTQKASLPAGVNVGGSLVYPGSGDLMYAFRGSNTTAFLEYSITNNTWTSVGLAAAPATIYGGGALTALDSNTLYAFRGNATSTFWKYVINTNTWTPMADAPGAVQSGGSLASDGSKVYATQGGGTNVFWQYDPGTNAWTTLTSAPMVFGTATPSDAKGRIVWSAIRNAIFAVSGNGTANMGSIMKYDPLVNGWPLAVVAPAAIYGGGSLTALDSNTLYALNGNGASTFWKYAINTGTWTSLASTPGAVQSGGSLANDGNNVYATQGAGTTNFWQYTVSQNAWSTASSTTVAFGGATVSDAKGRIIWSLTLKAMMGVPGSGTSILKNLFSSP